MATARPKKLVTLMRQLRAEGVQEYEDGEIRLVFGPRPTAALASVPATKGQAIGPRAPAPLYAAERAALTGFAIHPDVTE